MISRRLLVAGAVASAWVFGADAFKPPPVLAASGALDLGEAEWRRRLTPAQFAVLRRAATEPPFSSPLDHEARQGRFACAGCGTALFTSRTKYDSGTGWPSFWQALGGSVLEREDGSGGMSRTEALCRHCRGHLGHVFKDGPRPTGLRYCMNGAAMTFRLGAS